MERDQTVSSNHCLSWYEVMHTMKGAAVNCSSFFWGPVWGPEANVFDGLRRFSPSVGFSIKGTVQFYLGTALGTISPAPLSHLNRALALTGTVFAPPGAHHEKPREHRDE